MLPATNEDLSAMEMTDKEFSRLGEFIQHQCGIKMPLSKKTMLQTRLHKRLRMRGLDSFSAYADYVFGPRGMEEELCHMIDAVTTNKTDFFREPMHFDFLKSRVLAVSCGDAASRPVRCLNFWSAGCSTGEEPYTLAMVLAEHALSDPSFHFSILATDISTRVLTSAVAAVYPAEKIEPVPLMLRKKFIMKNKTKPLIRIVPALRTRVRFARLNFMDADYFLNDMMDVIFCRNVIIYFDRETQEKILRRICQYLKPGGYLFMGHSETLNGMDLPLNLLSSSIYRKRHENS